MSYDIRLKDPVTDETLDLPLKHVMTGVTLTLNIEQGKYLKMNIRRGSVLRATFF